MGKIRKLEYSDLEEVLKWRNSDEVRKYMFDTNIISWQSHLKWFEKHKNNDNKILLVFEGDDRKIIGYVAFTRLFSGRVAEWSFHVNPKAPKGSGTLVCKSAIDYVFSNYGIVKVSGQVISFNEKSLALHRKLGFKEEGILKQQYFDSESYHDIYCFGKF